MSSITLRIVAIFEILIVSSLGVVLPQYIVSNGLVIGDDDIKVVKSKAERLAEASNSLAFRALKTFSGGIIIAVAFCHLLTDSQEDLSEDSFVTYTAGYPVSNALALFGVLLIVCTEELTKLLITMIGEKQRSFSLETCGNPDHEEIGLGIDQCETIVGGHGHNHEILKSQNAYERLLKLALFEASVALHSIIIGYNLGTLGDSEVGTIRALMIALALHQFFEGFALGTILVSLMEIGPQLNVILTAIFACTTPVGIVIGMLTPSTISGDYAKGCANGVAAGFLIYAGLVEIICEEFSKTSGSQAKYHKPVMCLSMVMGAAFLALLAIWA